MGFAAINPGLMYKEPSPTRLDDLLVMSSDKSISNAANSARLKVNPEDDFLDDSGRIETIPVEKEYTSFNSSRLRVNPEDVFLDDGGQIEYQQIATTTMKKTKDPVDNPSTKSHGFFDKLSRDERDATGAEQSVRPDLGLVPKLKFTPRQMSDRASSTAGSQD